MSKKFLSLALALALCLGLTVPAFAAGTVKVVENETQGVKITMNGFLREETHRYNCDPGILADSIELTIYVVTDNSTVTVEALEGRKYADSVLQGKNRWASISFATDSPERMAYQDFLNNKESYAYDNGESWRWDTELKYFWDGNGPWWPLTGATTYTVSPTPPEEAEELGIYLDEWYGLAWMCESDYAKLVPEDGGQPTQPTVPTVGGFTDVKTGDYFADPVLWAVEKNITAGTSDTTFSPNADCTTAQILSFLWRANGSPKPTTVNPFTDVKSDDYYADAAAWAYEKGMVSGTAFGGNTPCTRSMAVTYMWKAAGSPNAGTSDFTDVPANADYAQAVAWAVEQEITSGTGNGCFSPAATCTRAQIVSFLYRGLAK